MINETTFNNLKIVVIGDVMLDIYKWGVIERISPEAPVPVVNICKVTQNLGGAGNVAANITALGGKCKLYTSIGNDREAEKIRQLTQGKIESFFVIEEYPTITKERIMGESPSKRRHPQQMLRIDQGEYEPRTLSHENREKILNSLNENSKNIDLIILSDYNKGFFNKYFSQEIIRIANSNQIPVFADPKPENIEYFRNSTLVSPNRSETEKITKTKIIENGDKINHEKLLQASQYLKEKYNFQLCTITCDSEGVFYSDNLNYGLIPAGTKKCREVSGAGDTFLASLSLAYAKEQELKKAVEFANLVSGIAVEKKGIIAPTIREVLERIN